MQLANSYSDGKWMPSIDSEEKLKMAQKGYSKDWPDIDILKNKHFCSSHFLSPEKMMDKDFLNYTIEAFEALSDLNKFLYRAMN